jgi:hypothetical protein
LPTFRRLSTEEIAAQRPQGSRPPVDLSPYLAFLRDFSSGEIGEITLGEAESQRVVKHRLSLAASQLKKPIRWRGSDDRLIRFEVREG